MKKVEDINRVYDILDDNRYVNRYVGNHKQEIIKVDLNTFNPPSDIKNILFLIKGHGFLAGGCLRAALKNKTDYTDYDIYAYTLEDRRILIDLFLKMGFKATYYNTNCVCLDGYLGVNFDKKLNIQIIFSFVGNPVDVIDEFDFTICRVAIDDKFIYKDKDFDENEQKKMLRIKTIQCPISAIRRIIKYTKKGYFISNFQIFKLYEDFFNRSTEYKQEVKKLLEKQDGGEILSDNELENLYTFLKKVD